jgi:hypothetical protein
MDSYRVHLLFLISTATSLVLWPTRAASQLVYFHWCTSFTLFQLLIAFLFLKMLRLRTSATHYSLCLLLSSPCLCRCAIRRRCWGAKAEVKSVQGTWGLDIISQDKVQRCDLFQSLNPHIWKEEWGEGGSVLCFNQSLGPGKRPSTTKIILAMGSWGD